MELYERRNLSATLDNWFASRSTAFDGFTAATATTVIFFFLIVNLTDSLCFSKHSSYNWICGFSAKPDWQPTFSQWAHGRTGTALPFYGSVKKGGGDKNRCVPLVISTATLPVPSISIGRRSSSLIHWMQSTL